MNSETRPGHAHALIGLLATANIPSEDLEDWGPVKQPLSEIVGHVRGREQLLPNRRGDRVGIWECTPGRWRRQVMEREFAHFVAGHAWFTPDGGPAVEFRAGDAYWFPAHTTGLWDIRETIRKSFVILGFSRPEKIAGALRRRLGAATRRTAPVPKSLAADFDPN